MGSSLVSINSASVNSVSVKRVAYGCAALLAVSLVIAMIANTAVADKNAPDPDTGSSDIGEPVQDQTAIDQGETAQQSAPPIVVPAPGIAPPFVLNPVAPKGDTPLSSDLSDGLPSEERPSDSASGEAVPVADSAPKDAKSCPSNVVWLRGPFGKARFTVDVADTRYARAQGLMNVPHMPASKGMLFVYEYPQEVAFWMKNTLIPLDIIYLDDAGVVSSIQANAIPGDVTPLPGAGLIQYVLEINGGLAAQLGIEPGSELQHPAISTPNWPCE